MKIIKNKLNGLSVGVKASIAYFLANLFNKAMAYITTPLYTNYLTSEEYGQVSMFLTWTSVIGIVAMFSLQAGVFNNGMLEFKKDRDVFANSMLTLSNLITAVLGIFLIISFKYTQSILKMDIPLLLLMLTIFFFQPAYNFWITRQRFEYKYKATTLVMIMMNILSTIAALFGIFICKDNNRVYGRLFGAYVVFIMVYSCFYVYTVFKARGRVKLEYWKFAIAFNLPLIPHYLSQYLMGSADKVMISMLDGDSAVAYYSVAYSVAAVVSIAWTSINASLVPYTYQKCEKKEYSEIEKVVTPLWYIFAAICLLLMFFAPELVSVMAPKEYEIGKYVIPPVIGGVFFQAMYYSFANVNYYYKKTKYVMYASMIAAIANVILNYLLIPKLGFVVAGYTTLLSYVIQAAIDYWAVHKVVSEEIFKPKIIVILSLSVIITASIFPLLYSTTVIRYAVLLLLFIVAFIFRKQVLAEVKRILALLKRN